MCVRARARERERERERERVQAWMSKSVMTMLWYIYTNFSGLIL